MQLTSTENALPPIDGGTLVSHATAEMVALTEFYRALNTRDLELLSQVWWTADEASMANPLGGVVRGWDKISLIYERMFHNLRLEVALVEYTIHIVGSIFYAVGREHGYVETSGGRVALNVRTTRIFRLEVSRWRQAHQHESIDDPQLLQTYQRMLGPSLDAQSPTVRSH